MAYEAYEASLWDSCGQQRSRSYNPDMSGEYQVHAHTCYACKSLEETRAKQGNTKGVHNFVVDAGGPLEPYRINLRPIDRADYDELTG